MTVDYPGALHLARSWPWFALVTTGRAGADFLQSLLDSHPQVVGFNGVLQFHSYWIRSRCAMVADPAPEDVADEFIGHHIHRLHSRYDRAERKDQLGAERNQSLTIDVPLFRAHLTALLARRPITSRNVLESVYLAYALANGEDLTRKRIVFHHEHQIWTLPALLDDFPDAAVVSMTRDPRALFVSGVDHWARFEPAVRDNAAFHYFVLNRTLEDARQVLARRHVAVRVEDLGNDDTLRALAAWLGIDDDPALRRSTWGGLRWGGDRLSPAMNEETEGFSARMLENGWRRRLGSVHVFVMDAILEPRLRACGYPVSRAYGPLALMAAAALIPWPTPFEWHYFSPRYLVASVRRGRFRDVAKTFAFYPLRVARRYRGLLDRVTGRIYLPPLLRAVPGAPVAARPSTTGVRR